MNDILDTIKNKVVEIREEYIKIIIQIAPLEEEIKQLQQKIEPLEYKKTQLEQIIRTIEHSLSLEEGTIIQFEEGESMKDTADQGKLSLTGPLTGKKPKEAYKETIRKYFKGKSFTGSELRDCARKDGLDIKDSYSRFLIVQLRKEGFIRRVRRGLYRLSKEEQEKTIKLHRVRSPLD